MKIDIREICKQVQQKQVEEEKNKEIEEKELDWEIYLTHCNIDNLKEICDVACYKVLLDMCSHEDEGISRECVNKLVALLNAAVSLAEAASKRMDFIETVVSHIQYKLKTSEVNK